MFDPMTLRKKYRFMTRLVPASLLAVALLVAVGVPVVAESAPSVSLSSQNIQSGRWTDRDCDLRERAR